MVSPTQTRSPVGQSERILVEQATLVLPPGIPVQQFASMSIEIDDPSERERATIGDAIHYDQFVDPSGSASIFPTDGAADAVFDAIKNRTISNVRMGYPDNDARSADTALGVRYSNVSQEDLDVGTYLINVDWEADFIE